MVQMVRHWLLCVLISLPLLMLGQQTVFEEAQTVYSSENVGGIIFHTSGWGATFYHAKYTSGFTKRLYQIDLVGMKHPKEVKINSSFENGRNFIYGKQYSLTILRTILGFHREFINKQSVKGVSVSQVYNIGISHGLAKPVFLTVGIDTTANQVILVDEKYDPEIHTPDNIYGKSSYFTGFSDMKYYPGLFAKFGLNFEYSGVTNSVKSLEAGIALDAFLEPVPIMAKNDNRQFYVTLYFSVLFGGKKFVGE